MFITVEGIDGSGKDTQIERIKKYFSDRNIPTLVTREPGGTEFGDGVRDILLSNNTLSNLTQMLLLFADRLEHMKEVIVPEITKGNVVIISNRHFDSTFAYQVRNDIDANIFQVMTSLISGEFVPDLTLYIDIKPETSILRMKDRKLDSIETRGLGYLTQTRLNYLKIHANRFKFLPDRKFIKVNGENSEEEVWKEIKLTLDRLTDGEVR